MFNCKAGKNLLGITKNDLQQLSPNDRDESVVRRSYDCWSGRIYVVWSANAWGVNFYYGHVGAPVISASLAFNHQNFARKASIKFLTGEKHSPNIHHSYGTG
jgi:hypothetical protein